MADLTTRMPIIPRATHILEHKRVEAVEITHLDSGQTEVIGCDTEIFTRD